MSRVAKQPIMVPEKVEIKLADQKISVKGVNGQLEHNIHPLVDAKFTDNVINVSPRELKKESDALAGTTRALINNMVVGVSKGFERTLKLVGVGYRAQVKGKSLVLSLGFSHPVEKDIEEGLKVETPSATEIVIKGPDKQRVGQFAANVRELRPPEPYKGKGIRYSDEQIIMKETKKK